MSIIHIIQLSRRYFLIFSGDFCDCILYCIITRFALFCQEIWYEFSSQSPKFNEQSNDLERKSRFRSKSEGIHSIIFVLKYIITAFSAIVFSPVFFVSVTSKIRQPQCPLNVGKQFIRRYLSISGL